MEQPKVRFSQSCELVTEEKDCEVTEIQNVTSSRGKIKVKSIVPVNFPIKVLGSGQRIILKHNNYETQDQCRNTSVTNELELSSFQKNSNKNILNNDEYDNEDSDIEFIGTVNNSKINKNCKKPQISRYKPKINSAYVNKNNCNKVNLSKVNTKQNKENFSNSTSLRSAPKYSTILQESNKQSTDGNTKKLSESRKSMQVMPCAKFRLADSCNKNKIINRNLQTEVKKNAVFHIEGSNTNVSIEAGTLHKNDNIDLDTASNDRMITSNDLLSQPEYNSMFGVMKNLKDIKKEKLVKDYEHLPKIYQNLVSEKITTGLDFALYETVYKDLIDLSINDDKLPARIFRSKDPEPRNKDIVPKLSDFYNPKYTEQYYTTANMKPLNPINLNTPNAFTISNKVHMWKMCRDNF